MKVRELIVKLLDTPMEAEVFIDINEDTNEESYQGVSYVLEREGLLGKFVVINSEWGVPPELRKKG